MEQNLIRFEVNDSYLAYTSPVQSNSNQNIVLQNGVYAVKKRTIDELETKFQVNTRTEWQVIYVDAFQVNLQKINPFNSPMPFKQHLSLQEQPHVSSQNPFH